MFEFHHLVSPIARTPMFLEKNIEKSDVAFVRQQLPLPVWGCMSSGVGRFGVLSLGGGTLLESVESVVFHPKQFLVMSTCCIANVNRSLSQYSLGC